RAGFKHIYTAQNAFAALRLLDRHKNEIDLLSLDIRMPGMDGLRLAEVVANTHSKIVGIVMLTAYGTGELMEEFLSIKSDIGLAEGFLMKPPDLRKLIDAYANALMDVFTKRQRQVELGITSIATGLNREIALNSSTLAKIENKLDQLDSKVTAVSDEIG